MVYIGFMWECECGETIEGEKPPQECPKCFKIDSFLKVPEEIAEERKRDKMEEMEELA